MFLLGGLSLVLPVVLVVVLIVLLAQLRDGDADEQRAPALYVSIVSVLCLVVLVVAVTGVAHSLARIPGSSSDWSCEGGVMSEEAIDQYCDRGDDPAISAAVAYGVAGLAALGLLLVHRRVLGGRAEASGAARRVHRAHDLVVCLLAGIAATVAAGLALYALWRVAAPGIAGTGNRSDGLRDLVPLVVLLVTSALLWERHWRQVTPAAAP